MVEHGLFGSDRVHLVRNYSDHFTSPVEIAEAQLPLDEENSHSDSHGSCRCPDAYSRHLDDLSVCYAGR